MSAARGAAELWIDADRVSLLLAGASLAERELDAEAVRMLGEFGERYRLLMGREDRAALYRLGLDLFAWVDGDLGALARLKREAPRPLSFEISGPSQPTSSEWTLLRAASSTSPSSSTPTPGASWAGASPGTLRRASCWTRWSRRSTPDGPPRAAA